MCFDSRFQITLHDPSLKCQCKKHTQPNPNTLNQLMILLNEAFRVCKGLSYEKLWGTLLKTKVKLIEDSQDI